MSHRLILRRRAEHDLAEAGLWYESRSSGTALYFLRCVDAAMELITRHPEIGPVHFGRFRRVLIRRFPYCAFYTIEPEELVVVHAVLHNSREPTKFSSDFWRARIKTA